MPKKKIPVTRTDDFFMVKQNFHSIEHDLQAFSKNIDLVSTSRNCKMSLKKINTERRVENPTYINKYSTNTHNKIYNTSNLKILHQNVRVLNRKTEEFLFSLAEINPQIICVTEHHRSLEEINICDFGQYTLRAKYCRRLFKYGGVTILTHRNLISKEIDLNKYCSEKDLEICAIKVKLKSTTLLILCVYRSPKGNFSYFLKQIEKLLTELYKPLEKIIMCGDFNVNFLDPLSRAPELESLLLSFCLESTVSFKTRVTSNSQTLIDNIFLEKKFFQLQIYPFVNGISDHEHS